MEQYWILPLNNDLILFLKPHSDPIPNLLRQFRWQSGSENLWINPNLNFNGSSVIFKFYWLKLKSLNGKLWKKNFIFIQMFIQISLSRFINRSILLKIIGCGYLNLIWITNLFGLSKNRIRSLPLNLTQE
jgi:hypothetical protein